ncbi:anthranilate synthase component I [Puccinia graminis f. sp. tritici CRL 75-36-700-3]|uniref:Anthranilate synthase component I n=1 Tax=Puccinia graminis f. sp. tritici (strain CRL 75-36-700-3 / race SCCL) TaxID=418459 RepID=E3KR49_PUCGT|nr:anthranilate synthase component I [Puccinia graminis f. sp. tritici CRL 75-36-700-3]EFP86774.2 anthranilate synthase component I [Puccinia graminis f. sp. tritici CRL 75-36-700-3]
MSPSTIPPVHVPLNRYQFEPSLEDVQDLILNQQKGNCLPVFVSLPADLLTPVAAYLKLTNGAQCQSKTSSSASDQTVEGVESFLLESVVAGSHQARYSFVGSNPSRVLRTGENYAFKGDPLIPLEEELNKYKYVPVPGIPPFTGGAIGYVSYDCVFHFEPTTRRPLSDPIGMAESAFMICDTVVVFDHTFQTVKVVSNVIIPSASSPTADQVSAAYERAKVKIIDVCSQLESSHVPLPVQEPIPSKEERTPPVSNVGKQGYESFVTSLKQNICKGDIIQAVPSQRLKKETRLHPFNVYRHLRRLNPSPYMFYINCGQAVQLIGASPECLCKVSPGGVVENHAIAGTIRRGKSLAEDEVLAQELLGSIKDRAEHVMLVDLARNDVNRVCRPETVNVDSLMAVEKFSHVMHLTSQVSGVLREGLTRFDAFRSIFPAGTVSGAPKLKAITLVAELEKERRGSYAGSVGRFNFEESAMDTCIAIRTMVAKDGVIYLQAGGGIVHDSVEEDEYIETINKLKANVTCIESAEDYHYNLEQLSKAAKQA